MFNKNFYLFFLLKSFFINYLKYLKINLNFYILSFFQIYIKFINQKIKKIKEF